MCNISQGYVRYGMEKGFEQGMEQGKRNTTLDYIKNLMETVGFTTEQAMDALKIPESEKPKYLALLEEK